MKKPLLTLTISAISTLAAAELPNAGTISRDATDAMAQPTAIPPIAVTPTPVATPANDSSGTTEFVIDRINLTGANLISSDKLTQLIVNEQGKIHTLASLQQLANTITQYYQQQGYPLAVAVLPPQRIENGTVTIQIIEGKLGNIIINNQSRLKDSVAQSYLNQAKDSTGTLSQPKAERVMSIVRDLAGVDYVGYQLTEGKNTGETDLLVNLAKAKALDGNISVDNYGSKSTGEVRTRARLNLNSPTGRGERISLEGMSSFKGVDYLRTDIELPAGYQGTKLTASLAHTKYELGGSFKGLQATGTANTASLGVNYPIKRSNKSNLWLDTSLQYSDLQDKVGVTSTITDKTKTALDIGINGYMQDDVLAGGYTQFSLTNTLGNLNIDSADAKTIDAASVKTDGSYYKLTASLNRTQFISPKWSMLAGVNGQWANKNLDSSEQLSLGGANGVSAYHSNDVSADIGVIGQAQIRYHIHPSLTVSGFYQAGHAKLRKNPFANTDNTASLRAAGLGINANYKRINLESKIGWRLSDTRFSDDKNPRVWVRVAYDF